MARRSKRRAFSPRSRWVRKLVMFSGLATVVSLVPETGSFIQAIRQGASGGGTYIMGDSRGDGAAIFQDERFATRRAADSPRSMSADAGGPRLTRAVSLSSGPERPAAFGTLVSLAMQYGRLSRGHRPQAVHAYLAAYAVATDEVKARVRPDLVSEARRSYDKGEFDSAAAQLEKAFKDAGILDDRK